MFQRDRQRKFRRRTNGRNNFSHSNNSIQNRTNSFSNGQSRNNFRSTQSPEKSFEKYTLLAKDALASGDKTLSENYLQHADHFIRIIEDRNKLRNENKISSIEKVSETPSCSGNLTLPSDATIELPKTDIVI